MQIEGELDTALMKFLFSEDSSQSSSQSSSSNALALTSRVSTYSTSPSDSSDYSETTETIDLFGSSLSATLTTYKLKDPKNDIEKSESAEVATLSDTTASLTLASVFPGLESTPFKDISFASSTFFHQNFVYDDTKPIGWHFSANWKIDDSCETLYTVLQNVLGVTTSTLSIEATLGTKAGWDRPLDVQTFAIQGILGGLGYSPPGLSWVHLTSIGARLFGIRMLELYPTPSTAFEYGFSIFGTMNLDLPGSTTPAECDYDLTEFDGVVSIAADISGNIWPNALGVQGLTVSGCSCTLCGSKI